MLIFIFERLKDFPFKTNPQEVSSLIPFHRQARTLASREAGKP